MRYKNLQLVENEETIKYIKRILILLNNCILFGYYPILYTIVKRISPDSRYN